MNIGDAINNSHHILHFMGGKFEREKAFPKSQQSRARTTTQPFHLQTLYYFHSTFTCSGQLA